MRKLEPVRQHLCQNGKLLIRLIEHAPVALAMFDRDMRHLGVSRRWSQYFGLEERDVGGQLSVLPELPDRWKAAHRRGLSGEIVRQEEDKYVFPDGTTMWISWEISPWFAGGGEIGGILIFVEDITQRKKAEENLEAVKKNLERLVEQRQMQYLHAAKLAALGKLAESIVHEFSSPLLSVMTVLKGFTDLNLQDKDKTLLELALNETSRMKDLVRSLQDFSRPSPEQDKFFELRGLIDSVLLLFVSHIKKKKITTEVHYNRKLPLILGSPAQIRQVIFILLENAVEACREGGRIIITTEREEEKIAVTIADDGVGMDPAQVERVFQPFYTTKRAVKGAGLGLSVVHGIMQSHYGEVRVASRRGEGSTFTVVLPVNGREAEAGQRSGRYRLPGLSA